MDKDSKTINLKLPTRWEELTQKQLRYLFSLIAQGSSIDEVKAFCLFRWNKITILHRIDDMKAHNSCMDTMREVFRQFMSKLILETIVLAKRNDGRFLEVTLTQSFLEYGLWQDYGTRQRNAAQVERRGGACSHLCRGAAGVAVTKRLVETPAISAVPKLLVQAERRVKLA